MRIGIYPDQAQAIKGVLIWGKHPNNVRASVKQIYTW